MVATAKQQPAKDQVQEQKTLQDMGLVELAQEVERLDGMLAKLKSEKEAAFQAIITKGGYGQTIVTQAPVQAPSSNGTHSAPPAKPARTGGKGEGSKNEGSKDEGGKGEGGGKSEGEGKEKRGGKGQWKPAILTFLREKASEGGSRLQPITLYCLELVNQGKIHTKVSPKDGGQVAQNVSQALNAMKKAEEVTQDKATKVYQITHLGVTWLNNQKPAAEAA